MAFKVPVTGALPAGAIFLAMIASCHSSRESLSSVSPDGHVTAWVHEHPSPDPPRQSIGVRGPDGVDHTVQRLGEDVDWCSAIFWSRDSSTVVFLVQDARAVVVDSRQRRIRAERWLATQNGYPTSMVVRGLSVSDDGRTGTFRLCPRRAAEPDAGCSPVRTVDLGADASGGS
jgi:hypothetical protein